jgi:hypothetical protein
VLHADGQRTPQELAGLLGRSAYAVTLDVRRLAAAGLIEPPAADPPAAVPATEPAATPAVPPAAAPAATPAATSSNGGADAREILPRRVPGTFTFEDPPSGTRRHLPAGVSALAVLPGAIDKAPDDSLLKRIRSALQSLR